VGLRGRDLSLSRAYVFMAGGQVRKIISELTLVDMTFVFYLLILFCILWVSFI
jgi:hypothetical protein